MWGWEEWDSSSWSHGAEPGTEPMLGLSFHASPEHLPSSSD